MVDPEQAKTAKLHAEDESKIVSWKIQITRAKPNPLGKDKYRNVPLAEQLLGEWVDLKNVGDAAANLDHIYLAHLQFSVNCVPEERPTIYWEGKNETAVVWRPDEVLRVHTGRRTDRFRMQTEDSTGVHHHGYANSGSFVLNNECGDTVSVYYKGNDGRWYFDDKASYDRKPPEGAILVRHGDKLVPGMFK